MVIGNGTAETIASIEGLNDLTALLLQTEESASNAVIASKGATTLQERREFIALGKNPDTGVEMSLQEQHYKLIMMNASEEEWQGYHEREHKLRNP